MTIDVIVEWLLSVLENAIPDEPYPTQENLITWFDVVVLCVLLCPVVVVYLVVTKRRRL